MNPLTQAHILGQERLRKVVVRAIRSIWADLPAYDRENVPDWLSRAVPVVTAGQRQSVALTNAYLARALDRRPLGVEMGALIGSAVRAGAPMDEVYTRPFVTHWTALKEGRPYEDALAAGLARAASTAAMDVQLTMRATAGAVQAADDGIYGYQRVADAGACGFCLAVDGAFLKSGDAMPLHNHCGCGLEPLTSPRASSKTPPAVAVHEHGELGPVLGDPEHEFTGPSGL